MRLAVVAALAAFGGGACAQAVPAVAPASGPISDAERAKRDAEKVFQWIRIHSDKPRKANAGTNAAAAADKPVAAAAAPAPLAKVATKAAPKSDSSTETARDQPVAAARPAAAGTQAAPSKSAPPQPEPVSAAVAARTDAAAPLLPTASPAVADDDEALMPVVKTEPEFPSSLMRQLRKGQVQVGFTVQPDGSVAKAHAVSSTHPRLVQAALATVSQWRFRPVRHAQQAVVDIGFNLD